MPATKEAFETGSKLQLAGLGTNEVNDADPKWHDGADAPTQC
ncbi:hypothetical protein CBM2626_U20042 [Cupriavidus taiwanensis]|uniref:Uncharacterized protein n=1 Tax=Cupriavidus taiwanensis TaxID=164546 RepID=A0A375FI27_9BURK|nr:hypothetical protein CBM2626_U20042 [Cupriavidus taiwanensis]SPA57587.1 protein of unknown function [Cupriavidus taiwanensis]SPD48699.1 protein of unknown function [Cupriavidus taiwanensis]